jgi:hypothetical protein
LIPFDFVLQLPDGPGHEDALYLEFIVTFLVRPSQRVHAGLQLFKRLLGVFHHRLYIRYIRRSSHSRGITKT